MSDGSVTIEAILDASGVERGAKRIEGALEGIGTRPFDDLADGAGKASDALGEEAEKASKAGDETEKAGEKSRKSSAGHDKLKDSAEKAGTALQVGLAGAAVAAGAAVFAAAADYEGAQSRIQAALGVSAEEAGRFRDIGASLYEEGWGNSLDQVTDALIQTKETIRDIDETGLQKVTENALALEKVFGADVNETIRGTNALMEGFGLTAEEASDLMAAGMQRGLNYTDELGDNLSEYAGRWGDAGMTASQYFSLLEAGTANGAYNLDKVGDFLNEFLTSLSDGRMEENIGRLSEGTQEVFENFKAGKATAEGVLNAVIGDLGSMTDETERASIASDLWSSLGEDNAMSMILAMGNVDDTFGDVAGSSEQVAASMEQSFAQKAQAAVRTLAGSLEGLGDPMLNIAEYAAELVTAFAEWFGSLSEGEQRAVVTFAAIAAAAVPVAKGVNAVKDAAKGAGGILQAASGAFQAFAEAAGLAGDGVEDAGKKSSKAKGKFSGLVSAVNPMTAMFGVLAGAAVYLGVSYLEAAEDAAELDKATNGLRDAVSGAGAASQGAVSGVGAFGGAAASSAKSVDELRESQAAWVDDLNARQADLNAANGTLDAYMAAIEDLAGRTDLSATEQAKLKAAVDAVNDACGTTYAVAQDAGGAYQVMADGAAVATDDISRLVEAQKMQAKLDVYQDDYAEAMQQEADAAATLAEAKQKQAAAQQKVNDALAAGWTPDMMAQYDYELAQANANLDEAQQLYDGAAGALSGYEEQMALAQMALEGMDAGYASFISNSSLLTSALMGNGQSLTSFRDALEATGVSTEALASLSDEQLTELANSYDGTINSISDLLSEYDEGLAGHAASAMETIDGAFGYSTDQLYALAEQFGVQGDAAMAAYAAAIQNGTEPAIAALSVTTGANAQQLQDVATQAGIKGSEAMAAYATAIQNGYEPAFAALATVTGANAQQLQDAAAQAGVSGDQAMSNYTTAINAGYSPTVAAAAAIKGITVDQLSQAAAEAGYTGADAVERYAAGIIGKSGTAESAGEAVAGEAKSGLESKNASAAESGSHLVQNFKSGMESMAAVAYNAAAGIASTIASALQFSVPEKGPWSGAERGGERSGEHLVENFARGIVKAAPAIEEASLFAASEAQAPFSQPAGLANDKEAWVLCDLPSPAPAQSGASSDGLAEALAAAIGERMKVKGDTVYNFYQPVESPDEIARAIRLKERYGLAARS
ncbi:MAG TPA: phage tail tape measure protein [Candidatus Aphodovivens avistercoris]|nr:phage tail tape measure protein [Candidatus Aphodovivens avistercoris]